FGQPSATNGFPSVFQPLFDAVGTNWFITGYREVDNPRPVLTAPFHDLGNPNDRPAPGGNGYDMFYGIPLVLGAKKGLPNFNEFSMQTRAEVWRRLEFKKPT